jgi:hypothetical protein
MADERLQLPHKLTLNERKNLTVTGVTEVVSFDENAVVVHTALGTLIVQGKDLSLKTLFFPALYPASLSVTFPPLCFFQDLRKITKSFLLPLI